MCSQINHNFLSPHPYLCVSTQISVREKWGNAILVTFQIWVLCLQMYPGPSVQINSNYTEHFGIKTVKKADFQGALLTSFLFCPTSRFHSWVSYLCLPKLWCLMQVVDLNCKTVFLLFIFLGCIPFTTKKSSSLSAGILQLCIYYLGGQWTAM